VKDSTTRCRNFRNAWLTRHGRHYEDATNIFDFDARQTYLAGLGIGLLATAAISLSSTLGDVPIAGAEVIRVAFRLGVLVDEISQNLQPRDATAQEAPESWAIALPEAVENEVYEELDAIHTREVNQGFCTFQNARADCMTRKHQRPVRSL
jgi:hypothetical protein